MSTQNPINNPTAHMGLRETYVGNVFFRDRDPRTRTTNDDYKSYYPGDRWINTIDETSWVLVKKIYDMGTATHQAVWVGFGGGGNDLEFLTPDVGGATHPDAAHNINILGDAITGVTTTAIGPHSIQITMTPSPQNFFWVEAPGIAQPMVPNYGYYATLGVCDLTLPALCPAGSLLSVIGVATMWVIHQNALQEIRVGNAISTIGVGGTVSAMDFGDCLNLLCVVANTRFVSIGGVGNLSVV